MTTIAATIASLTTNLRAAEERLAQVPAARWVIVWHGSVLKTTAGRVALLGAAIYCGQQAEMEAAAARFSAQAVANGDQEPAVAMPAAAALRRVRAEHKQLLASLPRV